jgi:hypothetical protein
LGDVKFMVSIITVKQTLKFIAWNLKLDEVLY